ncbi:hypothetical protein CFC21_001398 [Triticum aestivum]|uniref:Uncharacterized protein n=2 Tax=Triticum TaxID=4564 RepID=A0A9R0Q4Q7_TRITD|nr:hypothetical protein CFC21_001398 [Triticum aestivum]VAH03580.1 unnamed protein product [Triticum turgidum subsp. durum]
MCIEGLGAVNEFPRDQRRRGHSLAFLLYATCPPAGPRPYLWRAKFIIILPLAVAAPHRSSWCPRLCSREDECDRYFDLRCARPLGLAVIWICRYHRCHVDSSAPEYLKFVYTRLPSTSTHRYRQVPR